MPINQSGPNVDRRSVAKPGLARLFVLSLALLCAACGWQLRGTVALSSTVDSLHLTAEDRFGPLMTELRNRLEAQDVTLTENPIEAQYRLRITREDSERRVAALGADALASAYELTLTANFDVLSRGGQIVGGGLTALVTRSYNASGGNRAQEEALILGEMREDLAQQVLRQLQAVVNAPRAHAEPAQNEQPPGEAADGARL